MTLLNLYKNPVPDGADVGELVITPAVKLRYAKWAPTKDRHKGTVCVFQGRAEFIEKYFEVVSDLRRRGFWVATLDWRGQGLSSRLTANPYKGHIAKFSDYEADLTHFMKEIVLPDCPGPFFAIGHSMGGYILLRQACMGLSPFDRLVLLAPMIGLNEKILGYSKALVLGLSTIAVWFGLGKQYIFGGKDENLNLGRFQNNLLSCDRHRYERNKAILQAQPTLGIGAPTFGWLNAAMTSMDQLIATKDTYNMRTPTLLIGAGADKIVSNHAIGQFTEYLKNGQYLMLPHARHEILQETDMVREQFWAAFDAFIPGEIVR